MSRTTASALRVASVFGPWVFEMKIQVSKAADSHAAPKMMSIFCRSILEVSSAGIPEKQQRARRNHRAVSKPESAGPIDVAALAEFRETSSRQGGQNRARAAQDPAQRSGPPGDPDCGDSSD